mmetsp:Transcript_8048/g.10824  ORF Transcript_8048/g.10824 Transcript_8048/m.10824 type:complete len:89 (-) Transcript_8048:950-1216(-)
MPKRNAATVTALGQSSAYSRTCPHINIKNSLACSTDHSYEYQGKGIIQKYSENMESKLKNTPCPTLQARSELSFAVDFEWGRLLVQST